MRPRAPLLIGTLRLRRLIRLMGLVLAGFTGYMIGGAGGLAGALPFGWFLSTLIVSVDTYASIWIAGVGGFWIVLAATKHSRIGEGMMTLYCVLGVVVGLLLGVLLIKLRRHLPRVG